MKHIGSTTPKERAKWLGDTSWLFEKNNPDPKDYHIEDYKGFYYCTRCKKTWEYQDEVLYRHDLPKFKIKRKVCFKCKKQKKEAG